MQQTTIAEEQEFWQEFVAWLLQGACLIERVKLKKKFTNKDYRKAGKGILCSDLTDNDE